MDISLETTKQVQRVCKKRRIRLAEFMRTFDQVKSIYDNSRA